MTYVVCIPSYKRAALCNSLTLSLLAAHGIDPQRIYVYVADEEERQVYEATLDRSRYNMLVVGVPGIIPVREFIINAWPEGTHIVSIDDDIRDVIFRTDRYPNLDAFFLAAFEECRAHNAYIWGVHPVGRNAKFMQAGPEISTDLRYIVGAFYGFINRRLEAIRWDISRECNAAKDDVELTILFYVHDGAVVRFNRVGIDTRYFRKDGGQGCVGERRADHEIAAKRLAERYPKFGFLQRKHTGILDFTLRYMTSKRSGEVARLAAT